MLPLSFALTPNRLNPYQKVHKRSNLPPPLLVALLIESALTALSFLSQLIEDYIAPNAFCMQSPPCYPV